MGGAERKSLAEETRRSPASARAVVALAVLEDGQARQKTAAEIAALLRLAELDTDPLHLEAEGRAVDGRLADERRELARRLSAEGLETYGRALRAGRRPAVVRLVGSVCSGCHMRLHSKLDHQIRRNRGIAPCPYCLRLVYDPAWLAP